eukprot:2578491-Pyramimonas_sp.AAC.1
MRRIHEHVCRKRAALEMQQAPMDVDGTPPDGGDGTNPDDTQSSSQNPGTPPPPRPLGPTSRADRIRQAPRITFGRWGLLLGRNPLEDEPRRRGPMRFPVGLLSTAVRDMAADLVISRAAYVGDRVVDETGVTFALAGPDAWEQIKALVTERRDQPPGSAIPTVLMVDAQATQMDAALAAATAAGCPCC